MRHGRCNFPLARRCHFRPEPFTSKPRCAMRKRMPSLVVAMFALVGLVAVASARQQDQQPKMPPRNPNAGFLGAKFSPVTDELADQLKLDTQDGVVVI